MTLKRKTSRRRKLSPQKQFWFWVWVVLLLTGYLAQHACKSAPKKSNELADSFDNVNVISVYDGDTFKIDLNCSMDVYCKNISVRVLGVDTPEIKGKTAREKALAKQAKAFTQNFLSQRPVSLKNCQRDKYFRLLCQVTNRTGKDLAQELIKAGLGYSYDGGTKSTQFQ